MKTTFTEEQLLPLLVLRSEKHPTLFFGEAMIKKCLPLPPSSTVISAVLSNRQAVGQTCPKQKTTSLKHLYADKRCISALANLSAAGFKKTKSLSINSCCSQGLTISHNGLHPIIGSHTRKSRGTGGPLCLPCGAQP